jgi:hypothetical protein
MSCDNIAECTSTKNVQLLTAEVVRSDERVSRIAGPRVDGMLEVGIVSSASLRPLARCKTLQNDLLFSLCLRYVSKA